MRLVVGVEPARVPCPTYEQAAHSGRQCRCPRCEDVHVPMLMKTVESTAKAPDQSTSVVSMPSKSPGLQRPVCRCRDSKACPLQPPHKSTASHPAQSTRQAHRRRCRIPTKRPVARGRQFVKVGQQSWDTPNKQRGCRFRRTMREWRLRCPPQDNPTSRAVADAVGSGARQIVSGGKASSISRNRTVTSPLPCGPKALCKELSAPACSAARQCTMSRSQHHGVAGVEQTGQCPSVSLQINHRSQAPHFRQAAEPKRENGTQA